jgi:hypothetical protein
MFIKTRSKNNKSKKMIENTNIESLLAIYIIL